MMDFSEKEEVDDILPDTNVDRERTLTGKWALAVLVRSYDKLSHPVFDNFRQPLPPSLSFLVQMLLYCCHKILDTNLPPLAVTSFMDCPSRLLQHILKLSSRNLGTENHIFIHWLYLRIRYIIIKFVKTKFD